MRVLFIGLGSIGQRHLRILYEMGTLNAISFASGYDPGKRSLYEEYAIDVCHDLEEAVQKKPDFAVIANPTALHANPALELLKCHIPFLIEKPVSCIGGDLAKLKRAAFENPTPTLVGFHLRHHSAYKEMTQAIHRGLIGRILHVHGYVGQYLPDWRPETDYRASYSAKESLGGGVIMDLCHEIDISMSLLGQIQMASCMSMRVSDLDIETEDCADVIFSHQMGTISAIHLNYLERRYTWTTRVTGTEGSLIWDIGKGFLRLERPDQVTDIWNQPQGYVRDSVYKAQLEHWLAVLDGKATSVANLEWGIEVAYAALAAKQSARENRFVTPAMANKS